MSKVEDSRIIFSSLPFRSERHQSAKLYTLSPYLKSFMAILEKIRKFVYSCSRKIHNLTSITRRSSVHDRYTHGRTSNYFIEIRLIDRQIKAEMKTLEDSLSRKYRIGQFHYVPHISLVGGFKASHEKRLVEDFLKICSNTPMMKFNIKGWDIFSENNNVAFLTIEPSLELRKFRWQLANNLLSYCSEFTRFDHQSEEEFIFHGTIALHIPDGKFENAISFIQSQFPDHINGEYYVERVTLLKSHRILYEYDFFLREKLNREQARTPKVYQFTEKAKSDYLNHKNEEIHSCSSSNHRVFIYSDLHLDHQNIIKYCHRPFSDIHAMNKALIQRWNSAVNENDTVFFLGDLTYGRESKGIPFWWSKLNGNKIFIKGSHDKIQDLPEFHKQYRVVFEKHPGIPFLFVHDPKDKPPDWDGWIIHGHTHNNNYEKYPLVNGEEKSVNVSAELLDYSPLDIEKLFEMDFPRIKYLKNIHSEPDYSLDSDIKG